MVPEYPPLTLSLLSPYPRNLFLSLLPPTPRSFTCARHPHPQAPPPASACSSVQQRTAGEVRRSEGPAGPGTARHRRGEMEAEARGGATFRSSHKLSLLS